VPQYELGKWRREEGKEKPGFYTEKVKNVFRNEEGTLAAEAQKRNKKGN